MKSRSSLGWASSWLPGAVLGGVLFAAFYVDRNLFGATYVDVVRHAMLLAGFGVACAVAWLGIHTLIRDWRHRR